MRATECLLQSLWSSFFAILSWDEASWLGAALFLLEMEWEGEGQKQSPTQCKYTHTNERRTSPLNLSCQSYADNSSSSYYRCALSHHKPHHFKNTCLGGRDNTRFRAHFYLTLDYTSLHPYISLLVRSWQVMSFTPLPNMSRKLLRIESDIKKEGE